MPGARLPYVNIEKLRLESGGRGITIDDDATNFDVATWAGTSGAADLGGKTFLPAASAAAWWKVQSDAGTSYYIPLFSNKW